MKCGSMASGASPKLTSLCRASMAQPVGRKRLSFCAQRGVISMGHQQPPTMARTFDRITPRPMIWPSVLPRLPRIKPAAAASDA